MKRWLQEPLLHFFVLGAALFVTHRLVSARIGGDAGTIVVTQGHIASVRIAFSRTWQREPTRDELDALIRDRVREEVYYREALAMGLDRDDTIVRRRLRQKLEFVTDDVTRPVEPTDADLTEYLRTHADAFRVDRRITFRHVYLNRDKHGDHLADDATRLLARLREQGAAADPASFGDPFLLAHQFDAAPVASIAAEFGEPFASGLSRIPTGQWQGTIESAFGAHLVFIEESTEGRIPPLADVRDAVRREWSNARRLEANEQFYQDLLKRYVVTIEPPGPQDGGNETPVRTMSARRP